MITLEDCIALWGLGEAEILELAEREHIPEIAAAALAQYLLKQHGPPKVLQEPASRIAIVAALPSPRLCNAAASGAVLTSH